MEYYDSLMCRRTGKKILKRLATLLADCKIVPPATSDAKRQEEEEEEEEEDCLEQLLSSLSLEASYKVPPITRLLIPSPQPRQQDGCSCGPFTCAFAKALVEGDLPSSLSQSSVDAFRQSLIHVFLANKGG